ncbi:MAG TPA: DUF6185 family protein [Solirubrobacterales bacterium]|nr:DUF6185 family protein [Solirubrobacterales bacterium]
MDRKFVESTLTITPTPAGEVEAVGETYVRMPIATIIGRNILGSTGESSRRLSAEQYLASGIGVAGDIDDQPSEVSRMEVEQGELRTWSVDEDELFPGYEEQAGQFSILWDDEVRIRSSRPMPDVGFTWLVRIVVSDAGVQALNPPPRMLHESPETVAVWRFAPGEARSVEVMLELPWASQVYGAVSDGDWWSSWALALMLSEVLFILVLFLLFRRGTLEGPEAETKAFAHQLRWMLVASAFAVATSLAVLFENAYEYSDWNPFARSLVGALPSLLAVFCFSAVYLTCRPEGSWRKTMPAAAVIAAVFLGLASLGEGAFGSPGDAVELLVSLLAIAGLGVALYWLGAGLLLISFHWISSWLDLEPRLDRAWRRQLTLAAFALSVATATAAAGIVIRGRDESVDWAFSEVLFVADNLVFSASSLFPLVLLPAVGLLMVRSRPKPFVLDNDSSRTMLFVLYLFFVVPASGTFVGFRVPLPLLIAAAGLFLLTKLRRVKLERLEAQVADLNRGRRAIQGTSLLARFRRELVDRTFAIQGLRKLRAKSHRDDPDRNENTIAVVASRTKEKELGEVESYLQTGRGAGRRPAADAMGMVNLKFPAKPPVVYPGLGCGPGKNWQENGKIALHYGAIVAIVPVAYAAIAFVVDELDVFLGARPDLGVLFLADILLSEIAVFLVAAFVFGCLFSWLPWGNGPLKGLLLSIPAIASVGLCSRLEPIELQLNWSLYSFKLLFVLSVVGLLMDVQTMRSIKLRARDLFELYQVRSLRFGFASLLPIALSLLGIYFEIRSGSTQSALEHAIRATSGGG